MSFMFNPHPYDDPKAVNHICVSQDFCSSITQSTPENAKKLADQMKAILEQ